MTAPLSPLAPDGERAAPETADRGPPPPPRRTGPTTATGPAQPVTTGMPDLASLRQTRERPLFVPDRRGVRPVASAPAPAIAPPSEPVEEAPPPLTLVLSGVAAGPGVEMAILIDQSDRSVRRMRAGDEHDGWRLERVDRVTATFRRGEEEAVLSLKPPGVASPGGDGQRPPVRPAARPPVASGEGE